MACSVCDAFRERQHYTASSATKSASYALYANGLLRMDVYTKHNALTVTGNLFILGEEQDLSQVAAGYDFSAGYMRRGNELALGEYQP